MKRQGKVSGAEGPTPVNDFDAILALGSNIGDKTANLERAMDLLASDGRIRVTRKSKLYTTPPWGVTEQDWFLNACIGVETTLSPHELLARCQEVENKMGRVRKERWGPRVIDVDILVHRVGTIESKGLTLPHPRITERAFVLVPLADIAPDLIIAGKAVRNWLDGIDATGVELFKKKKR